MLPSTSSGLNTTKSTAFTATIKAYRFWEDVIKDIKDVDDVILPVEDSTSSSTTKENKSKGIFSSEIDSIIKSLHKGKHPLSPESTHFKEEEEKEEEEEENNEHKPQQQVLTKFSNLFSQANIEEQSLLSEVIATMSSCSPTNRNSKFHNPKKPMLTSLYESLDKCLTILKSLTPHSVPFLHRVSKKDVPDYYIIVKNPIDLGLIGRKLKEFQYSSKEEFVGDLELMRDNCYLFNEDPSSPFRRSADILRDRWVSILSLLPEDPAVSSVSSNVNPISVSLNVVDDIVNDNEDSINNERLSPWPKRGIVNEKCTKYPKEIKDFHQGIPATIQSFSRQQPSTEGIRIIISKILQSSGFSTINSDCMYIIEEGLMYWMMENIKIIQQDLSFLPKQMLRDLIEFLRKNE